MAKCDICGKGVAFGIQISHSHRRTNRTFKPNVQKVKAVVNGTPTRLHLCSRCLRSVRNGKLNGLNIQFGKSQNTIPRPEAAETVEIPVEVLAEIATAEVAAAETAG